MATQTQTSESTSPEQTTPNTAPKKAKNHFKGFNAVIKTTNDLKKNVARKLGKGGNASDAQDINIVIARMQYLDSLVESLPKVVKSFKRESDLLKDLTDHQKTLLTQTTDFHQQMIKDKTESDTISPVVVETIQLSFCQLHTELFSLETSLVEAINETSSALLQTAGVPLAKEQYKKWDVVRQQAEEANKKLENAKKDKNAKEDRIKALETELVTAKSALETADRETLAALETTIERIEVEYLNRIRSVYVEAYRKYFQQGQQLLKKVSDSLSDGADDEQLPTATAGEGSTAIQKKKKKKGKYNTTVWKAGAFLAVASAVAVAGYFLRMRK